MTKELKNQLKKRLFSLLWRVGAYVAVAGLATLVNIFGLLEVDPTVTALVALVVGEVTKFVNTYVLAE